MKRKTFKSIVCPEIPKNLSKVIAKKEINTVYAKIVKGFDNIISTGIMISAIKDSLAGIQIKIENLKYKKQEDVNIYKYLQTILNDLQNLKIIIRKRL